MNDLMSKISNFARFQGIKREGKNHIQKLEEVHERVIKENFGLEIILKVIALAKNHDLTRGEALAMYKESPEGKKDFEKLEEIKNRIIKETLNGEKNEFARS